jgi:Phosphorylase superfamily
MVSTPDDSTRRALLRDIIDHGLTVDDLGPRRFGRAATAAPRRNLGIAWPSGRSPQPVALADEPDPSDPLPQADVVVITWTVAELRALADVLTPGVDSARRWYRYDRHFESYLPEIRAGAPARAARRLASYYPTKIGSRRVLCVKSELHLNQDGVRTGDGRATLPVAELFRQVIAEVRPQLVITVGTCGATFPQFGLGDVAITRGAKFLLSEEFGGESFANRAYKAGFTVPRNRLSAARRLINGFAGHLREPDFVPPSIDYPWEGPPLAGLEHQPVLRIDGDDFKAFHPILSTDSFIFGTTTNELERVGCGVEMGDAVLGMVAKELGGDAPAWLVVRNFSNPAINGALPLEPVDMQAFWSHWYYVTYGYWTSVNSAIATWAMI